MREAIKIVGREVRRRPLCSSGLDPIEQSFSKLKAHPRNHAELMEALWDRIGALVNGFTLTKFQKVSKHAGEPGQDDCSIILPAVPAIAGAASVHKAHRAVTALPACRFH